MNRSGRSWTTNDLPNSFSDSTLDLNSPTLLPNDSQKLELFLLKLISASKSSDKISVEKSNDSVCEVAVDESVVDKQISEISEDATPKTSHVRSDPASASAANACEKIVSDLDKIEEITSKQSMVGKNILKGKSPQVSRVSDLRQFQKTRSFSAVEDTPDKQVIPEHLGAIPDFPLKDVSHSRSEQLETQPQQMRQTNVSGQGGSKGLQVDIAQTDTKNEAPKLFEGDTLIMQFDYYSNDQPMSLQNESQYSGASSGRSNMSELRKSGRDLSELSSDITPGEHNQIRVNRMNSRPRLD